MSMKSPTSSQTPIRAIVFDLFGVLVQPGWSVIEDEFSPSPDQWLQVISLSHACDKGIISVDEMVQQFAFALESNEADIWSSLVRTRKNTLLLDFITRSLKPHFKLAILSNIGSDLFGQYLSPPETLVFDHLIASADIGVSKPDPLIYKLAANSLSLPIEQCLFVDDSESNIRGAAETGMLTHLYDQGQWLDISPLEHVLSSQ